MKHLFKKTMCVAVAVLLLVGSLVFARAATVVDFGTYGDGISWALDSKNTLHVYGSGAMMDYAYPWHDYQPVIEKVVVYSGITHIGGQAFTDCTALADVSVPDSVTSIGVNAFFNCTSLTEIEIPDSVMDIYDDAFTNSGYYNDESNWENGVLYIDEFLIKGKTDISGECVIKDGTRIISCGAFQRCNSMTCVVVPDSVKTISQRAFEECAALESVTLPESITTLDENAFFECTSLTNIVIPENVTVLREYLFYGCSSLASVTIPASVTSIEPGAFGATALTDVYYTGSETQWNAITVGQYNEPLENAVIHYNSQPGDGAADDILPCDADLDGEVTAADARLALRASVGLEELTQMQILAADTDGDGAVTAGDARTILRKAVGLNDDSGPNVPDEPTTEPVDPNEPEFPLDPDDPLLRVHSYIDYACSCGEVQDDQLVNFLKLWVMKNYNVTAESQYHVQFVFYNDVGDAECVVSIVYDVDEDVVMVGSAFVAYDYMWTTMVQLTEDYAPGVGAVQATDVETLETVATGIFTVDNSNYVAGDAIALEEYDGYSAYRSYYEEFAGVGFSIGLQVMYDYLTQECGYIFDYADAGYPMFAIGLQ